MVSQAGVVVAGGHAVQADPTRNQHFRLHLRRIGFVALQHVSAEHAHRDRVATCEPRQVAMPCALAGRSDPLKSRVFRVGVVMVRNQGWVTYLDQRMIQVWRLDRAGIRSSFLHLLACA